jgi:hypothetical protein
MLRQFFSCLDINGFITYGLTKAINTLGIDIHLNGPAVVEVKQLWSVIGWVTVSHYLELLRASGPGCIFSR